MEQTKYIYLVFSKTGTWLSRTLNFFSSSKYVHASISFDNHFDAMYSFGRKRPRNPFSGGFVKENIFEGVYKNYLDSECIIYKIPITMQQFEGIQKDITKFNFNKANYRYNFLGLFGILLNVPLNRNNYYFCSQFVYELLEKHDILKLDKQAGLVTIIDLMAVENKSMVYEGFTKDLKSYQTSVPIEAFGHPSL